jgi:hypothetical protein
MTHAGVPAVPPAFPDLPGSPTNASLVASQATPTSADGETADEWLLIVDQVCHGVHHALNNRIGSLSALLELTRLGDLPPNDPAFASLSKELTRLEDCARTLRLLPRADADEEPLIMDDVLADVLAVHAFLHELRDTPFTIVPTRFVEPVRAERWALVRVLVLILNDAKRLAKANRASVHATIESDDRWVKVEFRVGPQPVADIPTPLRAPYAERLSTMLGGAVGRREGAVELRLPTLKTRRATDQRSA